MQGRVVAAGVSIAVGSALVGFMAAGDHSADASQSTSSSSSSSSSSSNPSADGTSGSSGTSATPSDGRSFGGDDGGVSDPGFQPQPQTRTGGS